MIFPITLTLSPKGEGNKRCETIYLKIYSKKLIIEIDLTKEFGLSKSGKTITIASTRGNQKIEGTDAIIGLNVYKYPETV